eukprot:15447509-Alexandrium_andersonii.AAC.1
MQSGTLLSLGSLQGWAPKVQSAIRSRPVSAAICLNPRSAFPDMRNCFKLSKLELRGPRVGLERGPRNSPGVRCE